MISRYIFFGLFSLMSYISHAQLTEDFSDGNILVNPVWTGNTDHFTVNTDFQLQLNASAAGESFISTAYVLPKDSLQFDFYFKQTFDPSDNNVSNIYFCIDRTDLTTANGYYLRLGENGTNDNIKIFRLKDGISTLLASCTMGAISKDPSQARLRISITEDGIWNVETNYNGENLLTPDVEFIDTDLALMPQNVFFAIQCKYTSTRTKNFFYDDISIQKWVKDTIPPQLVSSKVIDDRNVELLFTERLEQVSALDPLTYQMDNGIGKPVTANFGMSDNLVRLTFDAPILSGINYTLMISNLSDIGGNTLNTTTSLVLAVVPDRKDLVLNEILTDPFVGGEDFIELYNISTKFLDLQNLIIRNESRGEEKIIFSSFILYPGQYVAVSKNTDFLKSTYNTPEEALFLQNDLPAFNVSDAYIQVISNINGTRVVVDSFDYIEDHHFSLLNNTKGVSLEKIVPDGVSNQADLWNSSSQANGFATPGYKNSNFATSPGSDTEEVFLDKKIFSPYSLGLDPFLLISYNVAKSGFLATVKIFDIDGFPVKTLYENLLIGNEGSLKWDGSDDELQFVKRGWYIIATQLFHPDGEVKSFKHTVAVGEN